MDKLILRFVLFLAKTFLKKDVDFEKLKIIAETKLIMDRRRVRVTMRSKQPNVDNTYRVRNLRFIYWHTCTYFKRNCNDHDYNTFLCIVYDGHDTHY